MNTIIRFKIDRFLRIYLSKRNFLRVLCSEGPKLVFSKGCASKIWGGSVRSDFKKRDSFTLKTSKNHLIRDFLRNRRVRLKVNLLPFLVAHSMDEKRPRIKFLAKHSIRKSLLCRDSPYEEKKRMSKNYLQYRLSKNYV